MEFWFIKDKEKLQLPVPPPEFKIQNGNLNSSITVEQLGEISFIGKSKLSTISLSSIFPAHAYYFCQYKNIKAPYDCVKLIEKWRLSGNPIRLLITETPINMTVSIEDFEYGEVDGTGDVSFSINLKEYRVVTLQSKTINIASGNSTQKTINARPTKNTPKTYIVKNGDTLWDIAKRITGDGSDYKIIAIKNNIKNPNVIYVGQVLYI
ncbi:MAG: LysM peptidoglycan-binding domain-containing protein [Bacillota bacterium]|nr:LysM peptidoglycan-binding domain-containing protein [Bacillota bacterium]